MIDIRLFFVTVSSVAWISAQLLLFGQIESKFSAQGILDELVAVGCVHVSFVEDVGDVGEVVAVAAALDVVLYHRPVSFLRVVEGVVGICVLFVDLVLRQSHILFEHDEEGQLEAFLAVQDHEAGLLFTHIVFVLGFVVEGNLERGTLAEEKLLALGLPRQEKVLPVAHLHPQVELVGQGTKQLLD